MSTRRTSTMRMLVAAVALTTLATGCQAAGGSDEHDGAPRTVDRYQSGLVNIDDSGSPKKGGSLTFGAYSEPTALDPSHTIVAGSTGGDEMAAIFDELMRYDEESGKVVPQLAKSLSHSDDFTTWTLGLRDGVDFTDGTPLDAAAVAHSIERYVANGGDDAAIWKRNVTDTATPDDHTVVFTLARPWPSFEFLLTLGVGQIVAASSDAGGEFTPIGAGPYVLKSRSPQENLVLEANPHYWGGEPAISTVTFSYLNDPNVTYESFTADEIQMGFVNDAAVVDKALRAKSPGYLQMVSLGTMGIINAKEGHPGADPRVRRAIQLAVDPKVYSKRVTGGVGVASSDLFPGSSAWHTDGVGGLPYDPAEAKKLVAAAKADGFDGKITYLAASSASGKAAGVALKALLDAVGFDTTVKVATTITDIVTAVAVEGSYDMATWSFSWREVGPFARMFATSSSQGRLGAGSATSPELDALIDRFQGAATHEEQRTIMAEIQRVWNDLVPALIMGPKAELTMWRPSVHGVKSNSNTIVLLDQAWVD
ncbi:ABC transporter substrate-binding protein [Nocardioides ginsengisoli]|uniref:ABC transporter substrate-binding protein n=1 Tax=Nocardioides ginsengisoli TaxID=363868 RepID=A0ABW3VXY8_9ACTN